MTFIATEYCPQGCHNKGTCVPPYTCVCNAGWTGLDCNTSECMYIILLNDVVTYEHVHM